MCVNIKTVAGNYSQVTNMKNIQKIKIVYRTAQIADQPKFRVKPN